MNDLATMDPPGQVDAIAALPRDMAIIKMENDSIMAMAAAHPRDYGQVLASVRSQVETFPSFAREAIYAKPVGKDAEGRMKYARGLSVRAAEALAEAYRYNRIRTDVTPIDDNTVRVEATFVDYQTGRTWQDAGIVSKFYKSRQGATIRHSDERFYNVVVKAEASRRIRECILRCIPSGLRSALMEMIDEQVDSFLDDSTVEKIVAQFSTKGVTPEMLESVLSTQRPAWTKGHRASLLEMWNALDTGETTKAEMFGETEPTPTPAVEGQSATEKLAADIATPKSKPAPEPPPAPPNETTMKGAPPPPASDRDVIQIAEALEKDEGETFAIEGTITTVSPFSKFHVIKVTDGKGVIEVKRWTTHEPPEWCVKDAKVRMSIEVRTFKGRKQFVMIED